MIPIVYPYAVTHLSTTCASACASKPNTAPLFTDIQITVTCATSVTNTYQTTFSQRRYILILYSLTLGNVFKKLKRFSIIIRCWNIHWSVHLLLKQGDIYLHFSKWNKPVFYRVNTMILASWWVNAGPSLAQYIMIAGEGPILLHDSPSSAIPE